MTKKLLFLLVLLLTATTGAWAQEPVAKDIVVTPESGTNISDAIKDALGTNGDWALNITINLAKGGTYTITEPIVPSASIIINGNGATINAKEFTDHFIKMRKTPSDEYKVESGQYVVNTPSKIENVTITGLTKSLFYDNGAPYLFKDFTFNNCLINYLSQGSFIINLAASTVINFTIKNSTFYCKDKTTSSANCIAMSGKRPWQVTGFEDSDGKLLVDHNTFYNVAYKKQFFNTNTLRGQNKYKYEFNSNIFVNVSNKKIYGNMTNNKNQLGTDGKNTYLWDGEFFSETNLNGDAGLQTDPLFKDADNGDFTVGRSTDQYANKTGDTRWTTFKVMMKDGVMDADKWTVKVGEGEAQDFPVERLEGGEKITVTYTGTKKILGMKVEVKKGPASKLASEVTPDDIFKVIASDGMIYDNIAAAESAGTTAQGLVVYVGSNTGNATYTHGMALALKDEANNTWSGAKDACNAKNTSTPIVGALWIQASKDQWNTMFNAVGGDCKLRDCFSSAGGTNLVKGGYYWSGSSHEDYGEQGEYYCFNEGDWPGDWSSTSVYYNDNYYVRACIVF